MFISNLDAHNIIMAIYKAPLTRTRTFMWCLSQKTFLCWAYATIRQTVIKELHNLNHLYGRSLFKFEGGIENTLTNLEKVLNLQNLIRKFANNEQAVIFIKILMLEQYRKKIKITEQRTVFDEIVVGIYKENLRQLRINQLGRSCKNTICGDLLKELLMKLTAETDLDLLRQISMLQKDTEALSPFLKKEDDYIEEYKITEQHVPLANRPADCFLQRNDIECPFTLDSPIMFPVYLPNNTKTQCYQFEALDEYFNGKIQNLNKSNELSEYKIKHPILSDVENRVVPSDIKMAWSHLTLKTQKVCYNHNAHYFSLEKLYQLVLKQAEKNKDKEHEMKEEIVTDIEVDSQPLLQI